MADSFDALEFGWHLYRNWSKVAVCCATAMVVTLGWSLSTPKRYTATSTIMIQMPGSADPRGSTAVSPGYLESLKTYEVMAGSDSLFLESLVRLHLRERYPDTSIESLKRRTLEISKPASTRLIHISVTWDEARAAQALAQDLAERTVALSRTLNNRSGAEILREAQEVFDRAGTRLTKAQHAMDAFIAGTADGSATSQMETAAELRLQAGRDLNANEAELAGLVSRQSAEGPGKPGWLVAEIAELRARVAAVKKQQELLDKLVSDSGRRTEKLAALSSAVETELKAARASYETARNRLDEAKSQAAGRGELLEVLDPAIVPQRPSGPNTFLNLLVAMAVSLGAAVFWLAAGFGLVRARLARADREPRQKDFQLK